MSDEKHRKPGRPRGKPRTEKELAADKARRGKPGPTKGMPCSEDTKQKIRDAKRGKPLTEKQIAAYERRRGRAPTEKQLAYWARKRGTSADNPFKPLTEKQIAAYERSRGKPGPPRSAKAIAQTAEKNRGQKRNIAQRKRMSEAHLGKPFSEQHLEGIRLAHQDEGWRKRVSDRVKEAYKSGGLRQKIHPPKQRVSVGKALRESPKALAHRERLFRLRQSFPERLILARLERAGVSFKTQVRLPGSTHPYDIVLPERKVIIEVDGCFWHGCPMHQPLTRETVANWIEDSEHTLYAIGRGYRVIRLWEHDIRASRRPVFAADYVGVVAGTFCRWKKFDKDLKRAKEFFI